MAKTPAQDTESALFSAFYRVLIHGGAALMTAACLFLFWRREAGALHVPPPPWALLVAAVAMTAASIGLCFVLWRVRPRSNGKTEGKSPFTIETLIAVNTILFGLSLTFKATPTFINAMFWGILVACISFVLYDRLSPFIAHLREMRATGATSELRKTERKFRAEESSTATQAQSKETGDALERELSEPVLVIPNETITEGDTDEEPEDEGDEEFVDSDLEAALLGRLDGLATPNGSCVADEQDSPQGNASSAEPLKDRGFLVQETTRTVIEEGGASKEVVTGAVRVRLETEQRIAYAHVAFCPPFEAIPSVETWPDIETTIDPNSLESPARLEGSALLADAVSVAVDECLCGGTRFMIRRKSLGDDLGQTPLLVRFLFTASAGVEGK